MAVHKESSTVASVAKAHDAEVTFLGTLGNRQADSDQLVHKLHAKARHLVCIDEAGPCGNWLSRDVMSEAQPQDALLRVPPIRARTTSRVYHSHSLYGLDQAPLLGTGFWPLLARP